MNLKFVARLSPEETMRSLSVLALMIVLIGIVASCWLLPGESFGVIKGRIQGNNSEPLENCVLRLQHESGRLVSSQEIEEVFEVQYVVGHVSGEYHVTIKCTGYSEYKSKTFVLGGARARPVELGTISMTRSPAS